MSSSFDRVLRALAAAFVFAAVGFVLLAMKPATPAASSAVSRDMILGFLGQINNSSPSRNYTHWEDRLAEELKAVPNVRRAAERLAPEFGLSVHNAEQLIIAWVRWLNG